MNEKNFDEIFSFLDEKADEYNNPNFIETDPIQIPHRFSHRQDVEISAFFAATIAWGNRKSIIKDAEKIMDFMENSPYDFVMNFRNSDLKKIEKKSVHRTFNSEDFKQFAINLKKIYQNHKSLEDLFLLKNNETNFYHSIERFRNAFLGDAQHRSRKHVSSTYKNSAAKRLMMFLRWLVRKDKKGVDFGIWENLPQKYLSVPLDVHSGNAARKLGILTRKQNDWNAVEELDGILRRYKPEDPAVYDFALFGLDL